MKATFLNGTTTPMTGREFTRMVREVDEEAGISLGHPMGIMTTETFYAHEYMFMSDVELTFKHLPVEVEPYFTDIDMDTRRWKYTANLALSPELQELEKFIRVQAQAAVYHSMSQAFRQRDSLKVVVDEQAQKILDLRAKFNKMHWTMRLWYAITGEWENV